MTAGSGRVDEGGKRERGGGRREAGKGRGAEGRARKRLRLEGGREGEEGGKGLPAVTGMSVMPRMAEVGDSDGEADRPPAVPRFLSPLPLPPPTP